MPRNVADRLQGALPPDEWMLLQNVAARAASLDLPLYVVGGLPRDLLLGLPSNDFDLVVEGRAELLAKALAEKHGGRVTVHSHFATAKWMLPAAVAATRGGESRSSLRSLDFVTARSETYDHPGAFPTVKPGTLADDLRRRDFSINAIAIGLDAAQLGELRDEVGGLEDLEHGVVRVLHPRSFVDDPTRMYRAVRYEQRYGFAIAADTAALVPEGLSLVSRLSAQRIRHELDLMLGEPRAADMLRRLDELGLLGQVHKALHYDSDVARRMSLAEDRAASVAVNISQAELRWLLWLLPLPAAEIRSLESRLHFRASLLAALVAAASLWAEAPSMSGHTAGSWVERMKDVPPAAALAVALALPAGPAKTALERYLVEWRFVKPHTTGHDLKRLGLAPGARYQGVLEELRRAWLDGEISSDLEEQEYLRGLLKK